MPSTTTVSIVIPVYNRRDTTLNGLKSLARIDRTGLDVRTIIVDDGSTDGTGEAVRQHFPDVQVIDGDGTLHYAAGTNRGISAAMEQGSEFIVTANDDSVFHDQFLQRLVAAARSNPRAVVGAMLLLWDRPETAFQVGFSWNTAKGGWQQPEGRTAFDFPAEPFEVEGLAGNCVIFPAEAVRECGLMDEEKFPHGWGDIQYFVRMRRAGWKLLIEPRALVWCEPNTNPKPLSQVPFAAAMRSLLTDRRHPLNLQRQFIARWESAPGRAQALAAFAVYLLSLSAKTLPGRGAGR